MISYEENIKEYDKSIKNVKRKINFYKKESEKSGVNGESINAILMDYEVIYSDLIYSRNRLKELSNKTQMEVFN